MAEEDQAADEEGEAPPEESSSRLPQFIVLIFCYPPGAGSSGLLLDHRGVLSRDDAGTGGGRGDAPTRSGTAGVRD